MPGNAGHKEDAASRPLLFISHRHADRAIADVVRKFITDRSGGRIAVFQSSSIDAENPRVGRELHTELKQYLWLANVVVLVFTRPEEDWSYCMWECGVATQASPETKIIVLQCGPQSPTVYSDAVRVSALDPDSVHKFANEFLTSSDFFPEHHEAVAPGFAVNGDEVKQAAGQLAEALKQVVPHDAESGQDWATVPFLRLQLTFAEVDQIRMLDQAEGAKAVLEQARVVDIDSAAQRLFGVGWLEPAEPFARLLSVWGQERPDAHTDWLDELAEQLRVSSHWRLPRFRWQMMDSADTADHAQYAPVVSRVRSVPRQQCHEFDIYFSKFDTTNGAILIGFSDKEQVAPEDIPVVARRLVQVP